MDEGLKQFIERIPKAELHLHFDSITPEVLLKAAKRNNLELPYATPQQAYEWYNFKDLEDFLNKWMITVSVMLTEQDYYEAAFDLGKRMKHQNILRCEAMFTYDAVHAPRVELDVVMSGLQRGRIAVKEEFDVDLYFLADIDRTRSPETSLELVRSILPYRENVGIVGIGLDCQEVGYPAGPHKAAFDLARENGFFLSAHCGEEYEAGPEAVWEVIENMAPDRIDHGNQSIRDNKLVDYLVETQIPLTLCPMSNVRINVYDDISEHPTIALREKGVFVTVNSDDPPFMQNDLIDNYVKLATAFDLSYTDIANLARNSFLACYAEEDVKQEYLMHLDEWLLKESRHV